MPAGAGGRDGYASRPLPAGGPGHPGHDLAVTLIHPGRDQLAAERQPQLQPGFAYPAGDGDVLDDVAAYGRETAQSVVGLPGERQQWSRSP